jgi:hypothetical protein
MIKKLLRKWLGVEKLEHEFYVSLGKIIDEPLKAEPEQPKMVKGYYARTR